MNIAERLSRIQKLSNLYINRSIEFCDSSSTVMDELKDHIYYLLESPAYGNSTESIVKDFDPQLASLAFHLENSPKKQICFDSFLIVGGVGRSGTTAFGNALNEFFGGQHDFFMFTERYSWKLPYSPSSFLANYIFIEDSRRSQKFIQDKFDKFLNDQSSYDAIKFVGDKRPGASYMLEVNDRFFSFYNKKLLYLHLYRDPFPTALSWEKRAADTRDPWPTRWGAEMMAKHFISQAKIALKLHKSSQLKSTYIKFVDYDRFFFDKHYCAKLFDFIKDYLGESDLTTFQGSQPVANFVESNRDFVNNRPCHTLESFSEPSRLLRKSRNIYRKLRRYDS